MKSLTVFVFVILLTTSLAMISFSSSASAVSIECPQISNLVLSDHDLLKREYTERFECNYTTQDGYVAGYLVANYAIKSETAKSQDSCSGKSETTFYGGQIYSKTHRLNVIYEHQDDDVKNLIFSGAKSLLQQLESKNVAVSCSPQIQSVCSDPKYPYYNSKTDRCHTSPCFDPEYPYHNPKTNKCYTTSQSPYDWNELGSELLSQEKYVEAIDAYEKAISLDPNYKWAWYNKGLALMNLEKYGDALTAFNQVLRLDPNYDNANFKKGYALGKLDRHEEAIPAYLKELQLDPNDKWALNNLGWGLNELGRYEEALSYLDRSLKIDPTNTKAQDNKDFALKKLQKQEDSKIEYDGWIKQGTQYLNSGNFDEAIRNFDLAYKQNPNDQNLVNLKADALKKKGMALVEEGKFDLGVVFLGESNYLKPDEYVKASQNNAYNRWAEKIKTDTVRFDSNVRLDEYDSLGGMVPYLPVAGKVSGGGESNALILRLDDGVQENISPGTTLQVGDIVIVDKDPNGPPVTLDWGYATTTVEPGSVFLIGNPEDLQSFARTNPHYIELVEGQIKLYHKFTDEQKFDENYNFLVKTTKNPILIGGTDVTINHDKTTGISSIQIDDGWVEIFDVATNELKKFGVGTKLVTNNDGYYVMAQETEPSPNSNGGGCLIATATYGSELSPQVQQLRELRDNHLLQTESGTSFMNSFNDFYYSFSPYIADYERENPVFREAVKIAITPMITSLSILNYVEMDSESSVLGYGISLILVNIGMYIGIPAIVIVGIRKRF